MHDLATNAVDPQVTAVLARPPAHFIDGAAAEGGPETIPVRDPATGRILAETLDGTPADVDAAVRSAARAFADARWRGQRPADRERILMRFSDLLVERGEVFAQLETLEQGKSIALSRMFEVGATSEWMRFVAGLTTKVTGRTFETSLPGGPQRWTTFTRAEPVGVVAAIAPWNFPLLIAVWKIMPALAAGCSVVLKPSELTPLTALLLAEVAIEAGVPPGVFNVVTGTGARSGAALVAHPDVAKVSFTGSTATGRAIGRSAADGLKRVTLELGGKNPALVLGDAHVDKVVEGLLLGGFLNSGQVCAAVSRIYVERRLHDTLVSALQQAIGALKAGPGLDPASQLTPLVSADHKAKVTRAIADAEDRGAKVLRGAEVPDTGYFVSPALVLDPGEALQVSRDEIFGPVLNIHAVEDAEEAVRLANGTDFGLGASLWTRDLDHAMNLSRRIEAGTVWINAHVVIDPAMPFGGVKQSGIGRDFGVDWLDAYTETKSVCISH